MVGQVASRPLWWRALHALWAYVRSAHATFIWLAVLLYTAHVAAELSPHVLDRVLGNRSTNLHHLSEDPVRVLISSAFWLDGGSWIEYFLLYNIFHVPAERWLGTVRWFGVVVIAHVGATYISEGVLYWAIENGHAPADRVNTLDIGVSYALAGIAAVLTYRIPAPWRYLYLAGVLVVVISPLIGHINFTEVGHFSAALLGLACYPLVRSKTRRNEQLVPAAST
ncbi:rhomboid-like protein [Antrihabitans sp. NCIMB 15449]|uniref:Rhomboid-like protein n=1 Tax=Antrihabitans spumae TaxID=3373370 RepID=A0ABW7JKH0_9NOCA